MDETWGSGRWPLGWLCAVTTSPSSRSRSRRLGCWSHCGRGGDRFCPRSAPSPQSAWRCALIPVALVSVALLLLALRGGSRERRGGALGLVVGVGVVLLASGAALVGKDYIVERNLLPALIPLAATVGLGFGASGARRAGAVCAVLLCAYWLPFDGHLAPTPNLQPPAFRDPAERLGPPTRPKATLTWEAAPGP